MHAQGHKNERQSWASSLALLMPFPAWPASMRVNQAWAGTCAQPALPLTADGQSSPRSSSTCPSWAGPAPRGLAAKDGFGRGMPPL